MTNSKTQDFEKIFFTIVENSFLDFEKKEFFSALKTLNVSNNELIIFILDIYKNQTFQTNNGIEIILKDLPEFTLLKKITSLCETGEMKYLGAAGKLSGYLNAVLLIYMQELQQINGDLYESSKKTLNNNKELLRERFDYDETKKNNIIFINEEFKGQHSFTFKKAYKTEIFIKILNKLKQNKFVDSETSLERFRRIFSGTEIPNKEKVNWKKTKFDLLLFLKHIQTEFSVTENIYYTTLRCFTIKGKEILKTNKISKASGKKTNEKTIIDIISIFKNTTVN
ncbi:MAG: hypothetical protein CFE24_07270 [Flavobacterium sp. BFFFF2]|nr:MAG: hypothetical protein CFE24_07270 [Flavobacterium sp. BFFFF2]